MPALEICDVSVRFGGLMALDRVSLHMESGRITGLIGPNGAGKTTMFNVVTGLQPPLAGSVVLHGRDLGGLPPHRRARLGMARTFQRLELFGALTTRENVECAASMAARFRPGRPSPRTIADELMVRLGLTDVADALAGSLPTGQGRLLELARALATDPKVLLLDEPASGQTETETEHFAGLLRDLAHEGKAILLVEHDMSLVMGVCDDIFVLDFGRILASGSPQDVRTNPQVVAAYLGSEYQV